MQLPKRWGHSLVPPPRSAYAAKYSCDKRPNPRMPGAQSRRLNGEPQTTSLIDAIRDTQFGKQIAQRNKASLTLGSWMNPQCGT